MSFTTNLKWVAVLAVVAGCATESTKVAEPVKPAAAEKKADAKPADPYKTEFEKCKRVVLGWSMHTRPEEMAKKLPPVLAFIEKNKDDPKRSGEMNFLSQHLIETYWRFRDFKTGVPLAERLYADEKAGLSQRLQAAHYLAMKVADEKKDYAAADAYYAKLAAIKGNAFWPKDVAQKRAYLYVLRRDKEGAIKFLEGERAKIPERDGWIRELFDDLISEVYGQFFDYQGQLAFWKGRGNKSKMLGVYTSGAVSDIPAAKNLARDIILTEKEIGRRRGAWGWLWGYDNAFCRANLPQVLDKSLDSTNAVYGILQNKFTTTNSHCPQMGYAPAWDSDWACTAETWEFYREIGQKLNKPASYGATRSAVVAYAGLRDRAKAVAAAQEGLKNGKLKPEERHVITLMAELLSLSGDEQAMKAKVAKLEPELAQRFECPSKDRKGRFERAACVAPLCCDDVIARAVAGYYREVMDPVKPRKVYTVKFTNRPVAGAGDWANIPFKPEESSFDRKFGGPGMEFMTTDVATGDRGNAVKGGEKTREFPTTLQAVADEWGLHLVYTFYDKRARQFESGELDAGSFESYIAAGDGMPYYCFLGAVRKNARSGIMNTSYDSPGHRRIDPKDPTVFKSETFYTDDSIVYYTGFSWDSFAEHVPADGQTWDFESIFWGPTPAAWNGTASIHGRSTWGLLKFELGEAARVKILRQQLFRAVNLYKGEKTPGSTFQASAQEGIFDHWADDGVGDPVFYDKCLKPIVDELDPVAARVKVGMSDAEVKEIAEKYLVRFLEIRYEVARLRTRYLADKRTAKTDR